MSVAEFVGGVAVGLTVMLLYDWVKNSNVRKNISNFLRFLTGVFAYTYFIIQIVYTGALWILSPTDLGRIIMFAFMVSVACTSWIGSDEMETRTDERINEFKRQVNAAPDIESKQRIIEEFQKNIKR